MKGEGPTNEAEGRREGWVQRKVKMTGQRWGWWSRDQTEKDHRWGRRAGGAKRGELHQRGHENHKENGGLIDLVAGSLGCNAKLWKTSMLYTHHANTPPYAASDLNGWMYFKRITHYVELELMESAEILNTITCILVRLGNCVNASC